MKEQPRLSMADYGSITIRGARENNLKDVSLRLPKRKITIFTGVSGSAKSSLVFDTLASEAQRRLSRLLHHRHIFAEDLIADPNVRLPDILQQITDGKEIALC